MRFESYAQQLEDLILYCALREIRGGGYVDVGANDPTIDSVTKFFYDRGWSGINVEPLPNKCALLAEKRPRDINLCVGLSDKRGKAKIFEADGLSTFSTDIAGSENINILSNPQREKLLLTLSEVYERYWDKEREIHFCKIDVEGYEKNVLEGIKDWKIFRPWIFCIESTLPGTDIPSYEDWEDILINNDYVVAFSFGVNRYYVDLEKEYLIENFKGINQFVRENNVVALRMQRINFK